MPDVELPNPEEIEGKKHDTFTKGVALTVAVYAMVLAVASLGGNNAAKDANLGMQNASNQWAYYQAKVIRESDNRIAKLRLQVDLEGMPSNRRAKAEKLLALYAEEESRHRSEKEKIMKQAREFEEERNVALEKDPYFDYAEVLLQIAIVVATVSLLAGSRPVFATSVVLALLGAFLTLNGYTLLVKVPFLAVEPIVVS